jgi:glycosyltransferase involved in cell wall biosynthesis
MQELTISAVVPVWNEEETVSGVVETLVESPFISEVVCINDGSTDRSLKKLRRFDDQIRLVNYIRNHGKGYAMASGVKRARGDIVLFIDADLVGLSTTHIKRMIKPLLNGNGCKGVVGLTHNDKSDHLAGQRTYFKKQLLPYIKEMESSRYGVEVLLNSKFKPEEIVKVKIKDVTDVRKFNKNGRGYVKGSREYMQAGFEIAMQLAKNEGLLPKERIEIKKLFKVKSIKELREKVKDLQNKKIRGYIEKYVLSYFR